MGMSSTTQFGPRQSREASFEAGEKEDTKSRVAISLFFSKIAKFLFTFATSP